MIFLSMYFHSNTTPRAPQPLEVLVRFGRRVSLMNSTLSDSVAEKYRCAKDLYIPGYRDTFL
uniref:Uncharacterized protein n=1 Tax=Candidatus Kentrum sp. UNK TaxID=2126344 RepID=A0A450ZW95_9GAMM|nr:MAG: hypothetical protein BECKUNK1418G_GA0071005_10027 [Candidatus Kentron sp. UNK]VFK68244.1 MAG: hypothetical protein BECKUNK1418H_GA0071006_10017 [Candidatus Kentron sp. UNK]